MNNFLHNKHKIGGFIRKAMVLSLLFLCMDNYTHAHRGENNAMSLIQQLKTTKITISISNKTVDEVLDVICKQAKLQYVFDSGVEIDKAPNYGLDVKDATVANALTLLLKNTKYSYSVDGNKITIKYATKAQVVDKNTKISIKGNILDSSKKPIVGATVVVLGSTMGCITDDKGRFSLNIAANSEVEISFTGKLPQKKIMTTSNENLTIIMQDDVVAVDDVVVTGIFTRNQNTYSGATTTIKSSDLQRTGTTNIIQALGSLDPSFSILVNDEIGSNPNAIPDIQMRGAAAFSDMKNNYSSSPNQPLFIVDGFEQPIQKILDMDMNRVESVTLLKDATAKAIYGSKGANGVVVIETKAPLQGRLRVSYKGDLNMQMPVLRDYNLANASEKLEMERLAGHYTSDYTSLQTEHNESYSAIYKETLRGVDTDWLAQPTRVGVGHKHSFNIEGGDESLRYNVNLAYNNNAGVMKGSYRNTFEGGFNLQYRYKNLLFKEQLSIISNKGNESSFGNFSDYAKMNPYWRVYDENGDMIKNLGEYNSKMYVDLDGDGETDSTYSIYNPMRNSLTNYKNQSKYLDITNNFYVEWSIMKDLKAIGRMGITSRNTKNDLFYPSNYSTLNPLSKYNFINIKPKASNGAYFKRGLYEKTNIDLFSLSADITLNYSKQMGRNLIFANAQYNVSQSSTKSDMYEGQGFADNATEITQARQYKESSGPQGIDNKVHEIGFIGSVNYSYDSRYLLDANYRTNASSLFGSNNRWGHFWSVGAGWNIHNEKFFCDNKWLDRAKIRASFGYTGSQNFNAYQALATYSFFNDRVYDNVVGAYIMAMNNDELKWQQTQDQNIGLDLTLFKRFDLTVDYYIKNTSNLLTPITSAPSIGFKTYVENLGKSQNKGLEMKFNYRIIANAESDINLSIFGNIAHNKNKLVRINEGLAAMNTFVNKDQSQTNYSPETDRAMSKPRVEYAEGVSLSAIWGVRSLGIDPYNGSEIFLKKDGTKTYEWNTEDKVVIGDVLPKIQGTFGFNLDYQGFTINTIFGYRLGGQYYNHTVANSVESADLQYNADRRVLTERWNAERQGRATKYKKISYRPHIVRPTSRFIQNFNELRLSTLNVGYDFRNFNFVKKSTVVERLRVSFAMNDLFRVSTVKVERGTLYPYAQSFIFTVQATF